MGSDGEDDLKEMAASRGPVTVAREPVEIELAPGDDAARGERGASRAGAAGAAKLTLRIADLRRPGRSGSYDVYVALPEGARPDEHPDHLAGRISLYGPPSHAGAPARAFDFVLDVTKLRDTIAAAIAYGGHPLRVTIAPADEWSEPVTVGRVSLHAG